MKNKKGNVAVIALIIVIVAITASVVTWLVATKSQAPIQQVAVTQPAPVSQTQQTAPVAKPTAPASTALVYIDKLNGYQVSLPSDWTSYKVIDGDFLLPTSDKNWTANNKAEEGYGAVFSIIVYSLNDWNKLKADCGSGKMGGPACGAFDLANIKTPNGNPVLGQNSKSVFVVAWSNSGPSVDGDSQWGSLASEINGVDELRKRFSLTN